MMSYISEPAFAAAEFPSTIVVSNELTADWMKRFATAKIAFWRAPEMPKAKMLLKIAGVIFISPNERE